MAVTRHIRTPRGVRLMQHHVLISEVLNRPGPTHGFYDVLAASMRALASGPPVALLGFAGGGVMAPLRAMGMEGPVEAVDLSRRGYALFCRLCADWGGPIRWHHAEAGAWMRRRRGRYRMVVDDLSVPFRKEVLKPPVTWSVLPRLIRARLHPEGVAIFNLLQPPGSSWKAALPPITGPFASCLVVLLKDYSNRIVLASQRPLERDAISCRMRSHLRQIRSRIHTGFQVRSLPS